MPPRTASGLMQITALANASPGNFPKLTFYVFMNPLFGVLIYFMHTGGRGGKVDAETWKDVPFWTLHTNNRQRQCIRDAKYFNRADVIAHKEAEYARANPGKPGSDFWLPPADDPDAIEPDKFLVCSWPCMVTLPLTSPL